MTVRVAAALALALAATGLSAQIQIHVIDGPVQLQAGAETAPTLEAAMARVAAARAADDTSPARILLAHRTYALNQPLVVDAWLAGEGLEIAAAPSCSPTISGGRQIEGLRADADGMWRTTIDAVRSGGWWFEELFVDGRRAVRARHPNQGYARVVSPAPDNRTGFRFDPRELPPALLDDRSEVVLLHDWSISRIPIASVDAAGTSLTTTHPIGCAAPHYAITNFEPHPRFLVEGSPLLVDTPGEWSLDRATGELVYFPLPGERIDGASLVAPAAPALLRVVGEPEAPVRNVVLRGVRFAHVSWPIPAYGYAEGQASFYEQRDREGSDGTRDPVPAAVEFVWASDCLVERCTIESVGGAGLSFGEGCAGCVATDCTVRDTGATGVMIGEAAGRLVDGGPWWQSAPGQAASGNALRHSLIERCGGRFFGAVGVWIGLAEKTTIAACEIRDLPYTGVSIGWRWDETPTPCRENIVEANHIHHVMQALSDGGGIYTLGLQPGTVLRGNAIHDVPANPGRAPSNGMFLDQGTTGIVIEGNTFWAIDTTPLRWHWTYANTVRGNTFVHGEGREIAHYNRASADDIVYEDNRVETAEGWPPASVRSVLEGAGPRP